MPSSLTRRVGLRVGPIVLETLVKHYLEKIKRDFVHSDNGKDEGDEMVQLRREELMYDEIFTIVKAFLEAASLHPVEEVQAFSNTRTISPPWVHVVRVRVPMSSCDAAAEHLITALGGRDVAQKLIGGVKWWQVRSIDGVDAQWITAKKDWQEAKRRYKEREKTRRDAKDEPTSDRSENTAYHEDMDAMRCILYAHGGGYYFGSVDQERYSIQRLARKINGRVFAINYRLAPQYPFPCAIHDLLAAYLYLIQPPLEASHKPVKSSHIVVAGDSAGGGLVLALLQVIRDASLPSPAGAVLVSPWCDLTHSFPSIHVNTATDVIPKYGLSLHKPSTLWPPPDEELAGRVRTGLRKRVRTIFKGEGGNDPNASVVSLGLSGSEPAVSGTDTADRMPVDIGATTPIPLPHNSSEVNNSAGSASAREPIILKAQNGEILSIQQQIQLYTTNALLGHPLVSPALGYLGNMPPLLMIISDKEVLRDEGIYTAHKAAHPEQFPIKDETRALYPALYGIEERYKGKPTPVHLQVYDDVAHVLPVLFSFTTPAKYCFRAMATFCKYVTGIPLFPDNIDSLGGMKSNTQTDPAVATDTAGGPLASPPVSSRSFASISSSGSGLFSKSGFSIRRNGRKSTASTSTSETNSDLKRSASELQGRKLSKSESRSKRKARSVSVPPKTVPDDESGTTDHPTEGAEVKPKKSRIPPVPALPLALSLTSVPNDASPLSIPLPPSPVTDFQVMESPAKLEFTDDPNESEKELFPPLGVYSLVSEPSQEQISDAEVSATPSPLLLPTSSSPSVPSSKISPALLSPSIHGGHIKGLTLPTAGLDSPAPEIPQTPSKIALPPSPTSSPSGPFSLPQSSHPYFQEVLQREERSVAVEGRERCAGDPVVYSESAEFPSLYKCGMIRERVSTRGIIRTLEPPSELLAFTLPSHLIGEFSELAMRRYIEGRTVYEKKFSGTMKEIEKMRNKHLKKARKDTIKNMSALQGSVEKEKEKFREDDEIIDAHQSPFSIETALLASSGWSWSWALDHNEHPPPSSLVARRDTREALMLAKIADQAVLQEDQVKGLGGIMSGNNLWSVVVGFLTHTGNRSGIAGDDGDQPNTSSPNRRKEKDRASAATETSNSTRTSSLTSFSPSRFDLRKKASVGIFRSRPTSIGIPAPADSQGSRNANSDTLMR
ncbi:hypothetical protein GYMLUDRAFT_235590 [Collybiopsis luxurians FD-317 M1]|nr:hypothetical protein GYMLUDRAFT_235590 [Collybiopsis luxurians FD-317 M1]